MPYQNGVVSVGTTATLIATAGATVPENVGVLVQNLSAVIVYLGGPNVTAGTTSTGGLQLPASNTTPVNVPVTGAVNEPLYGIVASGTANVSFLYPA